MPRMSEAEKQKSHRRILDAAARLMRENGVASTSVADVMQAAGLTHGGFYRHFASKEDLVASAFQQAADGAMSEFEDTASVEARESARQTYIDSYLSPSHVKNRSNGCPLAGLGGELGRSGGAPGMQAAEAMKRMAALLPTDGHSGEDQGLALAALLLGTVTLARLAQDEADLEQTLAAGRTGAALLERHWKGN